MKNVFFATLMCFFLMSCGSSFQSFYDNHKTDLGTTSFQVPNFMKAVLSNISPEVKHTIGNISDLKYIKFNNLTSFKRQSLINEMNGVSNNGYMDVFRKNDLDNTRIISVKEIGVVVTDVIIFNSTKDETSAYYLQGHFDPEKIKSFADEDTFNAFLNDLIETYQLNVNPASNKN